MLRFSSDRCCAVLSPSRSFAGSPGCCCAVVSSRVRSLWVIAVCGLSRSAAALRCKPRRSVSAAAPFSRSRAVSSAAGPARPFSSFLRRLRLSGLRRGFPRFGSAARTGSFDRSGPAVLFPGGRPGTSPERFVSKPSVPAIPAAPVAVVPAAGRRPVPTINGLQPNLQPLIASLPSESPAGFRATSG